MDVVYTVSDIIIETLCFIVNVTKNNGGVGVKYFYCIFVAELSAEHGGRVD